MRREQTNHIVVHCTATPPTQDIGAAEIDGWHKARGWTGVGYHFVIRRDGRVEPGRAMTEIGAHVQGFNSESVAVALVGGVDAYQEPEENYTLAQYTALETTLRFLRLAYPTARILGHRDFPNVNKACPCFDVGAWVKEKDI